MNLQQTDRQTTVQLQQLKVSHVIGNVKRWIGPVLRNGRVYRLLTGQTRVNSGKQAPAKKVPLSDISITVQFNLKKNNCLMSHSHLMQYWILTFLYLLYSQVFGNTKEGNFLNMNCNCDSLWAYDWGETGGKGESNGGRSIIIEASKPSWSCTTCCTCTCCTSSTSSSSTQTWRTDTESGTTQQATRSSPGVVWCPHVVFCTISV